MSDVLGDLQQWYLEQCDGDWEHQYGIEIGNLDNPGWQVRIDLTGTKLEHKKLEIVQIERSERDWLVCRLEENRFVGFAGPENLSEILRTFLEWAKS